MDSKTRQSRKVRIDEYLGHSGKDRGPDLPPIPNQSYADHVRGVYERAKVVLSYVEPHIPAEKFAFLKSVVLNAALYHDLGKLWHECQLVLHGLQEGKMPNHTDAGTAHLEQFVSAAWSVQSHHRGFCDRPAKFDDLRDHSVVRERCHFTDFDGTMKEYTDRILKDRVKLHDSLVDIEEPIPVDRREESWFYRLALSILVDADHYDTANHYENYVASEEEVIPLRALERLPYLDRYVQKLQTNGPKTDRNFIKQEVYDAIRRSPVRHPLTYCSAEVGTGKTTAMIGYALACNPTRIIYVAPFTSIISQTVDVYRECLVFPGDPEWLTVAAHHHQTTFYEPEEGEDWESVKEKRDAARYFTTTWNSPIVCTTAVQFVETIASARTGRLRKFYQLAGAHIIIDESQATMPVGVWPIFLRQIEFLVKYMGCRVTFGSGTMIRLWDHPRIRKIAGFEQQVVPLMPEVLSAKTLSQEENRVKIEAVREGKEFKKHSLDELTELISSQPGCKLVVMNTIRNAAMLARSLRRYMLTEHLSTSLTPEDREEILKRVKRVLKEQPDKNWTLVATSCVEAGVDFSFHHGFREVVGLLNILQFAGRIRRNNEPEYNDAKVVVFEVNPDVDDFTENFELRNAIYVTKRLFQYNRVGPKWCERAITEELGKGIKMEGDLDPASLIRWDERLELRKVHDNTRVIPQEKITAIPEEKLEELEQEWARNGYITKTSVVRKSFQFYTEKAAKHPKMFPLDMPNTPFDGFWVWRGAYDKDFLGYMDEEV